MLEPSATLAALLEYLGLDADDAAVAQMLASAERSIPGMSEHRTTPDAHASIGRFARDLDPRLVEECERTLADAIALFGYPPVAART